MAFMDRRKNTPQDVWERVHKTRRCWLWMGRKDPTGYGRVTFDRKQQLAHRLIFTWVVGEIPDGMHVLHRCDNPPCVNPDHLFLGTNQDNVDDKMSKGRHKGKNRNHCKSGHPFSLENTFVRPDGSRRCNECARAASLKYHANHKETRNAGSREYYAKHKAALNKNRVRRAREQRHKSDLDGVCAARDAEASAC